MVQLGGEGNQDILEKVDNICNSFSSTISKNDRILEMVSFCASSKPPKHAVNDFILIPNQIMSGAIIIMEAQVTIALHHSALKYQS